MIFQNAELRGVTELTSAGDGSFRFHRAAAAPTAMPSRSSTLGPIRTPAAIIPMMRGRRSLPNMAANGRPKRRINARDVNIENPPESAEKPMPPAR